MQVLFQPGGFCRAALFSVLLLTFIETARGESAPPPGAESASGSPVVAEVDTEAITKEALETETAREFGLELGSFSPANIHFVKRRVLERMVERQLLKTAATKHFKSRKTEKPTAAELASGEALTRYLNEVVFAAADVSETEVQRYYQEQRSLLTVPEEYQIREIFIAHRHGNPVEQAEREAQVKRIREFAVAKSEAFAELARQYSEARSAERGGLRGYVTAQQMPDEVGQALRTLPLQTVSEIIRSQDGFHLVITEAKRGGERRDYADSAASLRQRLIEEKKEKLLEEHLAQLRTKYKVIIYYK
jgi:parvulin-like peptidyl-prolyl isomerase